MAFVSSSAVATLPCSYTKYTSRANSLKKLASSNAASFIFFQQYKPLIPSLSTPVARAYLGNESGNNTPETDSDDSDPTNYKQQGWSEMQLDGEFDDSTINIEIEKLEKNSRLIKSVIVVRASLPTVWNLLTDYERLADFIPGLALSQLLEKRDRFARLYQIGEQNLAFGLKFNAKCTVDCFERDVEIFTGGCRRDIDFKMVEGDFQIFEGKWSVEQTDDDDSITVLSYIVRVKPKMWLPVQLVEGRLCQEIKRNLCCIREQAEKSFHAANAMLQ